MHVSKHILTDSHHEATHTYTHHCPEEMDHLQSDNLTPHSDPVFHLPASVYVRSQFFLFILY